MVSSHCVREQKGNDANSMFVCSKMQMMFYKFAGFGLSGFGGWLAGGYERAERLMFDV